MFSEQERRVKLEYDIYASFSNLEDLEPREEGLLGPKLAPIRLGE